MLTLDGPLPFLQCIKALGERLERIFDYRRGRWRVVWGGGGSSFFTTGILLLLF
jgi:hypothetical protein